jgi:hypothetical protein
MSQNNAPNRKYGGGKSGNRGGGAGGSKGGNNGKNDRRKREPYCGVCFKAGKEKSVYNSHWTRENANPDSPIVCPLILSTVCGYCKETGHSIKYCEKRIRKNNRLQENASVSSTGAESGILSKTSSRASLASIDSFGATDNYNRKSRRQHRKRGGYNQDYPPQQTVSVVEEKPSIPPPPSKWISAVEDGDAMKSVQPLDLSMVSKSKGTFDSNGRRILDEWIPRTDDDSLAPIMPLPPRAQDIDIDIQRTFYHKRIHNWADCESDGSNYQRQHTPISMRDLNDVSPYHIPSSSSESSCNDDEIDPEYESYLIEV